MNRQIWEFVHLLKLRGRPAVFGCRPSWFFASQDLTSPNSANWLVCWLIGWLVSFIVDTNHLCHPVFFSTKFAVLLHQVEQTLHAILARRFLGHRTTSHFKHLSTPCSKPRPVAGHWGRCCSTPRLAWAFWPVRVYRNMQPKDQLERNKKGQMPKNQCFSFEFWIRFSLALFGVCLDAPSLTSAACLPACKVYHHTRRAVNLRFTTKYV